MKQSVTLWLQKVIFFISVALCVEFEGVPVFTVNTCELLSDIVRSAVDGRLRKLLHCCFCSGHGYTPPPYDRESNGYKGQGYDILYVLFYCEHFS